MAESQNCVLFLKFQDFWTHILISIRSLDGISQYHVDIDQLDSSNLDGCTAVEMVAYADFSIDLLTTVL